jgi:hypothetical protein
MNFENNWRRKQEIRGRGIADRIYRDVFGSDLEINRFEDEDNYELDKTFAIDVHVVNNNGLILTGQEKFLSNKYAKFQSITVEYMQNPLIQEKGDWFKMAVQFYFTGYFNKTNDDFELWIIADWTQIVLNTINDNITWMKNHNTKDGARANFVYCNMTQLPEDCIIASSWTITQPDWSNDARPAA